MEHDIMADRDKRDLRTRLVIACALFGGPAASGLDFAAAIEHLQNVSLFYDDIADGDRERRSQTAMRCLLRRSR